jgi:Mrp family chromosome partitioning ATPase
MYTIHFVLMGKGGVGKSMVASMLAQYLTSLHRNLFCADTDPTNKTFANYKALNVQHYNISDEKLKVDTRKFDALINRIAEHEGDCVVDTGASSFLPLMHYLHENKMFDLLESTGRRVVVHTPLVGGQAMDETIRGLQTILDFFSTPVLVWVNGYFGPVQKDGVGFTDSSLFKDATSRLFGVVFLQELTAETSGEDVADMTKQYLTFDEALESPNFFFSNRHRLRNVRKAIYDQLAKLDF